MTVSTTTNSVVYRGNGAATQFAVPFKVLDVDHLIVKRRVYATGVIDYTYLGTDYSYSGIGASSGTLTLSGTALSSTYELVIERVVPYTQELDIVNSGGFYPETAEEQLDMMAMATQQLAALLDRAALVPIGEAGPVITRASARAGKYFAFDADGAFVASAGTGADSALRTDLAVAATGTALLGYDPALAAATTLKVMLDALNDGIIYSSLFPTLKAAILAWMTNGGTLIINKDYTTSENVTNGDGMLLPNKNYFLTTDRPRTITYNGAATHVLFEFYNNAGPAPIVVDGDLTLNCNNLAATGIYFRNEAVLAANRRSTICRGLKVTNAKMVNQHALGANGISVNGGHDLLLIENNVIDTVTRGAGTGIAGSFGCTGIGIGGGSPAGATHAPRQTIIRNNIIKTITTEDAVGTVNYADMDAILCFLYRPTDNSCAPPIIENNIIIDSGGRAVKRFATMGGGATRNNTIYRSVRGVLNGSNDLAHQDGSGTIEENLFYYTSNAHAGGDLTIPMGASLGSVIATEGATFRNNRIFDTTGVTLEYLITIFNNQAGMGRKSFTIDGLYHSGTSKYIWKHGALGYDVSNPCSIALSNIDVNLTEGCTQTDDAVAFTQVTATRCRNRSGSNVPAMNLLNDNMKIANWGDWRGDATLVGFVRFVPIFPSHASFSNGFRGEGGGCMDAPVYGESMVYGRTPLGRFTIASMATLTLPPFGSNSTAPYGGDFIAEIKPLGTPTVLLEIQSEAGNDNLSNRSAVAFPAGWDVRSDGATTGAGTNVEVYKPNATQLLTITNRSASSISVEITFR